MSLPSNMFVARDIIQTILRTFFLGHPVACLELAEKFFWGDVGGGGGVEHVATMSNLNPS